MTVLVPEAPDTGAEPVGVVVAGGARPAVVVTPDEAAAPAIARLAGQARIARRQLDDVRVGRTERRQLLGRHPGDRRIDGLADQSAVVPLFGAPVAPVVEPIPPDAALRAVDILARHVLAAALVVARLGPLAHAVRSTAVLGLGAARVDPPRDVR